MKALEELTADIREKLPRLKELGIGCVFCYPTSEDISYIVTQEEKEMISFNRVETFSQPRVEYISVIKETRLIVGKNPMLNDVLERLNDDSISIYCDGCLCNSETGLYYLENGNDIIKWDMSKPYLKDQSPELINFLHGLINH